MPDSPPIKRLTKHTDAPKKRLRFDVIGKDDPRQLYAWEKLSKQYRQDHPLCQRCQHLGTLDHYSTIGISVHHIRALFTAKDKEQLYDMCFDVDNLLTLCSADLPLIQ